MRKNKKNPLILINYEAYRRKVKLPAIALYHHLANHMSEKRHEIKIHKPSIADDIGVSVPTLRRYLKQLVDSGFLIDKKERTVDGMNRYIILIEPIEVKKPESENGDQRMENGGKKRENGDRKKENGDWRMEIPS